MSSPVSLTSDVTPESAFIEQNMTWLGQLTVKSPASLEPGNLQVNVTAVAKRSRETDIFTLEIVILKTDFAEDEIKEKEESTGMSKIIGIVLGCALLLLLILLVACLCMRKRGSWTVWRKKKSRQPKERVKVEITNPEKNDGKPELV